MCSGLGHIHRGYEVHMRELFDVISDSETNMQFYLLKGAGKSHGMEKTMWCAKRNSRISLFCKEIFRIHPPYLEQFTFFISSIYYILIKKPSVIYCADYMLSAFLAKFKKFFGLEYLIVLRNGNGYLNPDKHVDFVQQLLKYYNIRHVKNSTKQFLIPHGFDTRLFYENSNKKNILRSQLKLPQDKTIILSVGALDMKVKRMDYIVNEFSILGNDFFLLLIGNIEEQTPSLLSLIESKIPVDRYKVMSLSYKNLIDYYCASDIFCLASLSEGFGRVYVEAALAGLPVIAHDHEVAREVLGSLGFYTDMSKNGNMVKTVKIVLDNYKTSLDLAFMCKKYCTEKYDWKIVIEDYKNMFMYLASRNGTCK